MATVIEQDVLEALKRVTDPIGEPTCFLRYGRSRR